MRLFCHSKLSGGASSNLLHGGCIPLHSGGPMVVQYDGLYCHYTWLPSSRSHRRIVFFLFHNPIYSSIVIQT
ncbi:hypothetical protein TMatcc_005875 [Talaromyces marneffei ATCC 18224]